MRLQLTIQRHALPPTNILWTVKAQDPTSTSAHTSATISQLLEDVNDIVQLESDDWGLEDYVAEVGGYECLHFQPIDSVLKEDDKVTIRALQTSDLRIRRIGGRHQITADGRHLFDGVAFGRPYLRKTARPAFPIPPRKRRKLDLGHGQYIEDDSIVRPLLPGSENAVETALHVTDDSADSLHNKEGSLRIVTRRHFDDADQNSAGEEDDGDFDSDFESFDEEEEDEEDLELSEELKALLEDEPSEPGDDGDGENDPVFDVEPQFDSLDTTKQHKKRKRDSEEVLEDGSTGPVDGSNILPIVVHRIGANQLSSTSTSISGSGSEAGDEVDLGGNQRELVDDFDGFDERSHSSDTSSSQVTSSGSESEIDSSNVSSSISGSVSSSSEADSDSDSDSDSNSESESLSEMDSQLEDIEEVKAAPLPSMGMRTGQAAKTEPSISTTSVSSPGTPDQGLRRTQKRNDREKKKKRLYILKAAGLLAPDARFNELTIFEQNGSQTPMTDQSAQRAGLDDAFEARKQELHDQLMPTEADSVRAPDPSKFASEEASHALTKQPSFIPQQPTAVANGDSQHATPKKRAKLDLDSLRRMVFRSLGLKTPKTPAAEQDIREKLSKQGRTTTNGRAKCTVTEVMKGLDRSTKSASGRTEAEDWKDKLILSAVECEVESQVLSKPPFPFVQRWQHGKQRNQAQDDLDDYGYHDAERLHDTSTAAIDLESGRPYIDRDSVVDGVRLNGVIQNQLIGEAPELSERQAIESSIAPDLPSIMDMEVLEALKAEDAVVGTVIAFKQFDMSKQTNWQPQISDYRTAKVQEVLEDGTLKILLAERNRTPVPPIDNETGERIFDKFDMPIEEEGDGDADNGIREVLYGDLIEPKLVYGKTLDSSVTQPTPGEHNPTSGSKPNEEISQVQDSARSTSLSAGPPSAQVEVSTPRQMEISKLIKDAGFHSSLDSELLQSTSESPGTASHGDDLKRISAKKHMGSRSMNLDGAATDSGNVRLDSPHYVGDSSSVHQNKAFDESSSNFEQRGRSSSDTESQGYSVSGSQKGVAYPRISQLVTDESGTLTMNGKPQSPKLHSTNPIENSKPEYDSDAFDKDDDGIFKPEESHFDSLKSTIPPSEDAAPRPGPPSRSNSLTTNPCYSGLDGDATSEDDLLSLSEITSTTRSGKVSPLQLKRPSIGKRKKSTSPKLPSESTGESTFAEYHTQTQTSSRFEPSQIPPGSQIVDLTFSSDPISPDHSDEDYASTQRSSARIKQSSSQVKKRESLASGAKTCNRRLVRGILGRAKP